MRIAGRQGLFRLSKLGQEFGNNRFIAKDGTNLRLNEDDTWTELTFEPWLLRRAQQHRDWNGDTAEKKNRAQDSE